MLVASLATCHQHANAQVVFQFDASKNVTTTTSNLTWQSLGRAGSTNLPQLVADANDWGHMANNSASCIFNLSGEIASPLRFAPCIDTNKMVRQIIAVVDTPIAISGMSTLFCSTEIYRTAGRPQNRHKGNLVARLDTGKYCRATWSIDGVPSAPLRANSTHLLIVTFSHDLPLHSLGIGSDTGRHDAWERGFCGSFKEIIGFSEPVPDNVVRTITHYANLKWRLGLEVDSPSKSDIQASRNLGAHFGPFYGSLLIIK